MTCRSKYLFFSPSGPIPHNMARPLMVRQPYSVAVPSTGGRFTSPLPEEEGLGEKVELSLQERRRGRKMPFLMVKKVSVPCKGNRKGLKNY